MNTKKVYAVVALGVFSVSWAPILVKAVLQNGVSPDVAAFYRMLFSFVLVAPFVFLNRGHRRSIAALSPRDRGIAVLSGVFLALHFITWYFSVKYTSVLSSTVLVNLSPVFLLAVEAVSARRWPRAMEGAGVLIALTGLAVLSLPQAGQSPGTVYGNILAVLAAVFVAGYFWCNRIIRPKLHLIPYSFMVYGVCALGIFLWVVTAGRPLTGYSAESFALFGVMALVCTMMGHSLFQWSQRYIRPSALSVCILGEPVIATVLAFLLYKEVLGPLAYAGGAVLLAGIAVFNLKGKAPMLELD